MKNEHLGSNPDDFLEKEGLRAGAEAAAIKRAITYQSKLELKRTQPSTPNYQFSSKGFEGNET
jgi:hypothetical protein